MAQKQLRPARTLLVFFLSTLAVYGLVALADTWKPALGLDLQGGTRITLEAKDNPSTASLNEAASIIDSRVNGSGVSEASVTVQENDNRIIVEIPGKTRSDLEETVKRQAQLRFRMVAQSADGAAGAPTTAPSPTTSPGAGVLVPSKSPSVSASVSGDPSASAGTGSPTVSESASPKGRAPIAPGLAPTKSPKASGSPSASDSAPASPTDGATPSTDVSPTVPAEPGAPTVDDPMAWALNPDPAWVTKFATFTCPADGAAANVVDDPKLPLITCDTDGVKYLLSASLLEGTALKSASAGIPQGQAAWVVSLSFDGEGTKTFGDISRELFGTQRQFAIVLDGQVLSAPTMDGLILDGRAQISGNFTESTARSLATSLKFGALPIAFDDDAMTVELVGPSLAGNQLSAGITAGIAGLLLVMLYCLFYYRGLGLVVIASLVVAAVLTYGLVLLLSKAAGFTLSLPGIAGLIVAVGITADSFIVFFERIRDEMRDGKSMRVAVEAGWVRARNTCLAADAVSLLAAVVLYVFAAGVVKGFAFALGLSTLIDLVVFFWFTHPLVSWLGRFPFFNKGHKLSGLDAENLGIERLPAGGRA